MAMLRPDLRAGQRAFDNPLASALLSAQHFTHADILFNLGLFAVRHLTSPNHSSLTLSCQPVWHSARHCTAPLWQQPAPALAGRATGEAYVEFEDEGNATRARLQRNHQKIGYRYIECVFLGSPSPAVVER